MTASDDLPDLPLACGCGRAYWPIPGDGGECGVCRLASDGDNQEAEIIPLAADAVIVDGQHRLRAMMSENDD